MALEQVVLVEPLSADRATRMGLESRDHYIGEQITVEELDADRLRHAGYLAPVGVSPTVVYGGGSITVFDANNVAMPTRTRIRFAGSGVTVADSSVNQWTDITITGGSGGTTGSGVTSVNGKGPGAVTLTASDVGAVTSVNGKGPGIIALTAADVGALTQAVADVRYDPYGGLTSAPMVVVASGTTWPLRSSVTTNPSKTVLWVGSSAPPIGGGYAASGVDLWLGPDTTTGSGGTTPVDSSGVVWLDVTDPTTQSRPSGATRVVWVGGATQPVNMVNGDVWLGTSGGVTPSTSANGNLDGGTPTTVYGGTTSVDGGTAGTTTTTVSGNLDGGTPSSTYGSSLDFDGGTP